MSLRVIPSAPIFSGADPHDPVDAAARRARRLSWFGIRSKPSPEQLALSELEDARRELLAAQSAKEYAENIAKYNAARIARLTTFLREQHKSKKAAEPSPDAEAGV